MNFTLGLRHERNLMRRHGGGYLCARLAVLLVLALSLCFAYWSLAMLGRLVLGPQPLSLARGLQGEQTSWLLSHALLAVLTAGLGWLAYGLWLLDVRAWWLALALSAPTLLGDPGAAYAHLVLLFTVLLLCSYRTFKMHTPRQ